MKATSTKSADSTSRTLRAGKWVCDAYVQARRTTLPAPIGEQGTNDWYRHREHQGLITK